MTIIIIMCYIVIFIKNLPAIYNRKGRFRTFKIRLRLSTVYLRVCLPLLKSNS